MPEYLPGAAPPPTDESGRGAGPVVAVSLSGRYMSGSKDPKVSEDISKPDTGGWHRANRKPTPFPRIWKITQVMNNFNNQSNTLSVISVWVEGPLLLHRGHSLFIWWGFKRSSQVVTRRWPIRRRNTFGRRVSLTKALWLSPRPVSVSHSWDIEWRSLYMSLRYRRIDQRIDRIDLISSGHDSRYVSYQIRCDSLVILERLNDARYICHYVLSKNWSKN